MELRRRIVMSVPVLLVVVTLSLSPCKSQVVPQYGDQPLYQGPQTHPQYQGQPQVQSQYRAPQVQPPHQDLQNHHQGTQGQPHPSGLPPQIQCTLADLGAHRVFCCALPGTLVCSAPLTNSARSPVVSTAGATCASFEDSFYCCRDPQRGTDYCLVYNNNSTLEPCGFEGRKFCCNFNGKKVCTSYAGQTQEQREASKRGLSTHCYFETENQFCCPAPEIGALLCTVVTRSDDHKDYGSRGHLTYGMRNDRSRTPIIYQTIHEVTSPYAYERQNFDQDPQKYIPEARRLYVPQQKRQESRRENEYRGEQVVRQYIPQEGGMQHECADQDRYRKRETERRNPHQNHEMGKAAQAESKETYDTHGTRLSLANIRNDVYFTSTPNSAETGPVKLRLSRCNALRNLLTLPKIPELKYPDPAPYGEYNMYSKTSPIAIPHLSMNQYHTDHNPYVTQQQNYMQQHYDHLNYGSPMHNTPTYESSPMYPQRSSKESYEKYNAGPNYSKERQPDTYGMKEYTKPTGSIYKANKEEYATPYSYQEKSYQKPQYNRPITEVNSYVMQQPESYEKYTYQEPYAQKGYKTSHSSKYEENLIREPSQEYQQSPYTAQLNLPGKSGEIYPTSYSQDYSSKEMKNYKTSQGKYSTSGEQKYHATPVYHEKQPVEYYSNPYHKPYSQTSYETSYKDHYEEKVVSTPRPQYEEKRFSYGIRDKRPNLYEKSSEYRYVPEPEYQRPKIPYTDSDYKSYDKQTNYVKDYVSSEAQQEYFQPNQQYNKKQIEKYSVQEPITSPYIEHTYGQPKSKEYQQFENKYTYSKPESKENYGKSQENYGKIYTQKTQDGLYPSKPYKPIPKYACTDKYYPPNPYPNPSRAKNKSRKYNTQLDSGETYNQKSGEQYGDKSSSYNVPLHTYEKSYVTEKQAKTYLDQSKEAYQYKQNQQQYETPVKKYETVSYEKRKYDEIPIEYPTKSTYREKVSTYNTPPNKYQQSNEMKKVYDTSAGSYEKPVFLPEKSSYPKEPYNPFDKYECTEYYHEPHVYPNPKRIKTTNQKHADTSTAIMQNLSHEKKKYPSDLRSNDYYGSAQKSQFLSTERYSKVPNSLQSSDPNRGRGSYAKQIYTTVKPNYEYSTTAKYSPTPTSKYSMYSDETYPTDKNKNLYTLQQSYTKSSESYLPVVNKKTYTPQKESYMPNYKKSEVVITPRPSTSTPYVTTSLPAYSSKKSYSNPTSSTYPTMKYKSTTTRPPKNSATSCLPNLVKFTSETSTGKSTEQGTPPPKHQTTNNYYLQVSPFFGYHAPEIQSLDNKTKYLRKSNIFPSIEDLSINSNSQANREQFFNSISKSEYRNIGHNSQNLKDSISNLIRNSGEALSKSDFYPKSLDNGTHSKYPILGHEFGKQLGRGLSHGLGKKSVDLDLLGHGLGHNIGFGLGHGLGHHLHGHGLKHSLGHKLGSSLGHHLLGHGLKHSLSHSLGHGLGHHLLGHGLKNSLGHSLGHGLGHNLLGHSLKHSLGHSLGHGLGKQIGHGLKHNLGHGLLGLKFGHGLGHILGHKFGQALKHRTLEAINGIFHHGLGRNLGNTLINKLNHKPGYTLGHALSHGLGGLGHLFSNNLIHNRIGSNLNHAIGHGLGKYIAKSAELKMGHKLGHQLSKSLELGHNLLKSNEHKLDLHLLKKKLDLSHLKSLTLPLHLKNKIGIDASLPKLSPFHKLHHAPLGLPRLPLRQNLPLHLPGLSPLLPIKQLIKQPGQTLPFGTLRKTGLGATQTNILGGFHSNILGGSRNSGVTAFNKPGMQIQRGTCTLRLKSGGIASLSLEQSNNLGRTVIAKVSGLQPGMYSVHLGWCEECPGPINQVTSRDVCWITVDSSGTGQAVANIGDLRDFNHKQFFLKNRSCLGAPVVGCGNLIVL